MPNHEDIINRGRQSISQAERDSAKAALKEKYGLSQILGKSRAVCDIHDKIKRVSSFNVNVLISGESGTGKELVARAIHYLGPRAGKPFIPVNCGAIPENLFENELFGHVKGAFTGAGCEQTGLVKEAEGGTLFLDEIGTISQYIQVKLLRLLENSEYKPLGKSRCLKADLRIIAATNMPLTNLVNNGSFRDDLYYRLNVVYFHIPPLRERLEDIPILTDHFVNKYSKKYNRPDIKISTEALGALVSHPWKGNIRELENMLQSLIIMSESNLIPINRIQAQTIEPTRNRQTLKTAKTKAINAFEKNYLIRILTDHRGNVARAAIESGKGRTALWNLIKKHNLQPKQFRA
jgi:transcriptional regulator with PAS, ATPase and Fis domain